MNTTVAGVLANNRLGPPSWPRDRLGVATAILDSVFISVLFWLALLLIVR